MSTGLPAELRQAQMRDLVASKGFVRVRELTERFGVSAVTVRTDLDTLESRGQLRRVHGGAMAPGGVPVEHSFEETARARSVEKAAIGRAAAALVQSGEAVILDVGTTTTALARSLVERADLRDVTVFTNGLTIALELEAGADRLTVVVTGGTLRRLQHSLVNPLATELLGKLRASTAFLGCNGVDVEGGVTNVNLAEAEVKRAMAGSAVRRVVVADGSKIGAVALAPVCSLEEVDVLVTDASADPALLAEIRARGVDVVTA